MKRFFLEEIKKTADGFCVITGSEARHISKVLRMKKGDRFLLMDRIGDRYETEIESISSSEVLVRLLRPLQGPDSSGFEITLCQAILKTGHMDFMIEKSSELGVTRIMPFFSERTVVKLDHDNAANKVRRWREKAVSAAKQSDRAVPAEISMPGIFTDILREWQENDSLKVILWEKEESKDLKELLRAAAPFNHFVGLVGPEGGFSTGEVDAAAQSGFIPVSLGKRILRAETAAMALVAVVQYEWGDLSLEGGC